MRAQQQAMPLPGTIEDERAGHGGMAQAKTSHKMLLLAVMYLSQTIPMGFIMGGLPVMMRSQGNSLKSIGFLFMLLIPWAIKFTYATFIDSHYLGRLGRRRSWILPMQWLTVLIYLALSQTPPGNSLGAMFALCFVAALAMATNDIAVDGYATDMLTAKERPWGNTIQAGSRSVGIVLGGGIPLLIFEIIGWPATCALIAAALLALSLPVLFHREIEPQYNGGEAANAAKPETMGMLSLIRQPASRWLIAFFILSTLFFFFGFQMRTPLLTDLGMNPQGMGMALIWCGSPAGLLGSILGGWLYQRLGPLPLLGRFILAALGLAGLTAFIAAQGVIPQWCAFLVLGLDNLLLGVIHVWSFTLMMKASVGPQSGAKYALYSSAFLLPPMLFAPIVGAVGDKYGFVALYILLAGLLVLGFWGARAIASHRLGGLLANGDD